MSNSLCITRWRVPVTFDATGNTLSGGGRAMAWDSQNRMASCVYKGTTSTFRYGADGLRRQATVNGVTTDYAYDGQTLIREGFASGGTLSTLKATYLQGPRGSECRIDETNQTEGYYRFDATGAVIKNAQGQPQVFARGVTKWYVYDGLGSVVGEVDVNGNLTSSPKYDVYGLVRSNAGTASSAMGFVGGLGHLSEAGTGLIYMKARYYDPALGRFASEDTAHDGENWFVYCGNDPVNEVDQNGKNPLLIAALALAVIGFLAGFLGSIGSDYFNDNPINWPNAFYQGGVWALAGLAGGLVAAVVGGVALTGIAIASAVAITAVLYFMLIDDDFGDFPGPTHDPDRTVQPILG